VRQSKPLCASERGPQSPRIVRTRLSALLATAAILESRISARSQRRISRWLIFFGNFALSFPENNKKERHRESIAD
jgi:hypothetical protein